MFIAIYEMCPKAGQEAAFPKAWAAFTREIYKASGSYGSRLHATGDPKRWIAYAQWPSRAAWAATGPGDTNAEYAAARDAMWATLESSQTLFELESEIDLLQRATFDEGRAPARGDALTLSLTYHDAEVAIAFLRDAYGFQARLIVPDDDGHVIHSELVLGSAVVFVGSAAVKSSKPPKALPRRDDHTICVWVADPDAHFAHAVQSGARIVRELQDEHYGARGYLTADPEGHQFYFSNYVPGEHWTADTAAL